MSTGHAPSRELNELAVAALLGSDRAATVGETSATLLTRAAAAGLRAQAGRRCRAIAAEIERCPTEAGAPATASQAALLERLLASPEAALIKEWCALACARRVCVPAVMVPIVLDWWARQPGRTPEVFDATGACGAWLAGFNPGWRRPVAHSVIPPNADELWQTGSAAERAALLTTVRKIEPARALAMLQSTWGVDGADERRRFVEVLVHRVSAVDELFLESALDDRSKTVRHEAQRVLIALAGSGLRARMRERAAGMIVVGQTRTGLLRRTKVTIKVEPPKAFDKAWERDGIEEHAAAGQGQRAFWMTQVLSATDLAVWSDLAGIPPSEVVSAIGEDEYVDEALDAMLASIAACPEQPDAALWSDEIVTACAARKFANLERLSMIWGAQTVERSEALRLRYLRELSAANKHQADPANRALHGAGLWGLLASDARSWSLEYSVHAAKILRDAAPAKADPWEFWPCIESVSKLVHPGAADRYVELIGDMFPDGESESVRKSLDRIRLRAEMHREFST